MARSWEHVAHQWYGDARTCLLRPVLWVLKHVGVTANALSYAGVLLMILFVCVISTRPTLALCLLLVSAACDMLDGSLARYLGTASDRGKFTDVLADNLVFTLFVIGLLRANLLSGLIASLLIYTMLLLKVLLIIRKNLHESSEWLIHPMAGVFPNVFVFVSYAIFALYVFMDTPIPGRLFIVFVALLVAKILQEYVLILRLPVRR